VKQNNSDQMSYVYENSNIVRHIIKSGGNVYDCLYWLVKHQEKLVDEIMELTMIAPKKVKLENGKYAIWHCPDELIPETEINMH